MLNNTLEALTSRLKDLFVPSPDYFVERVGAVKEKFGFVKSVSDTISVFTDFFDTVAEGEPPKLEIHLENAEGGIDYGGVAYALDMSWYARYKPSVDVVLSSIIWVFFVWRLFVKLPSVISGISGGVDVSDKATKVR